MNLYYTHMLQSPVSIDIGEFSMNDQLSQYGTNNILYVLKVII